MGVFISKVIINWMMKEKIISNRSRKKSISKLYFESYIAVLDEIEVPIWSFLMSWKIMLHFEGMSKEIALQSEA